MSTLEIFKWTGVVFKYSGYARLTGLYEKKTTSKWRHVFVERVIPLFYFIMNLISANFMLIFGLAKPFEGNLTDLLSSIHMLIICLGYILHPLVCYFRLSARLVHYLQRSKRIDALVKPHQKLLKITTNLILIGFLVVGILIICAFHSTRLVRYDGTQVNKLVFGFVCNLFSAAFFLFQPQMMYIVFHMILCRAFHELHRQIKEDGGRKGWNRGTAKTSWPQRGKFGNPPLVKVKRKLREYSRLYCSLCHLCHLLDDMVSPMLTYQFLSSFNSTIFNLTFLNHKQTSYNYLLLFTLLTNVIVLLVVPNFTYNTQKTVSKILPTLFSTFNYNDKHIKKEMEIFGLQAMFLKPTFTASGFFKINRELIMSMVQAIITQSVTFYKLHKN